MTVKKYDRLLKSVFVIGLFALPFVFWPWAYVPFEIPKVWFVNRWVEILTILGLISSFYFLKKEKLDSFIVTAIIIFFLLALVASFTGPDLQKSLWGNYYRKDGLFTLLHLVVLSFFVGLFFKKTWIRPTSMALGFSTFFTSSWIILHSLALNEFGSLAASFGNPNFLAGFLLITLPFLAYLSSKARAVSEKYFWYLAVFLQIIAIIFTLSWGGIFGVLIFLTGWVLIRKKNTKLVLAVILVTFLLSLGVFVNQQQSSKIPNRIVAEGRERIFQKGLLAINSRPILGWGWANFDYAFESVDWPISINDDAYVDKAHSMFLEILAATGILGLIAYLVFVSKTFLNLTKSNYKFHKYLLLSFVLYLIHSQTNVISIGQEVIFWIIIGIAAKKSLLNA